MFSSSFVSISNLNVRKIFDSRGEETIALDIESKDGDVFSAEIPKGKSVGAGEALSLPFSEIEKIKPDVFKLLSKEKFRNISEVDKVLIDFDGTENKSKIGANFMLGISIAFTRAFADKKKKAVWEVLREEFFKETEENRKPLIFSNLINGGAHAKNNLDIQEYMVVVKTLDSFTSSISVLIDFYKSLGDALKRFLNVRNIPIGDEGGYSVDFVNNFEPIKVLENEIKRTKMEKFFTIGLDVAGSNFYKNGFYNFEGKQLSQEELVSKFEEYFNNCKFLCTIEDPFSENDKRGFSILKKKLKNKWIIGDDLTTTNRKKINENKDLIRGVIIKPNQIGSVSETCLAIKTAKENGLKTIVSHRSGETSDCFIIHLAKAGAVDGVKIGAPFRERILKFNELIRLFG